MEFLDEIGVDELISTLVFNVPQDRRMNALALWQGFIDACNRDNAPGTGSQVKWYNYGRDIVEPCEMPYTYGVWLEKLGELITLLVLLASPSEIVRRSAQCE